MLKKKLLLLKSVKARDFMVYGFGQAFNLITPLLIIPYIVLVCGEEGLGKIGISMSMMFMLIVIVDYGSYIKGVKEVALNRNDPKALQDIFSKVYALKFLLLAAVCGLTVPAIFIFPYFKDESPVFLLSLFIIIGQFVNPGWFLQGIENFKWITITNIVSKLLYVFGILLFVHAKSDYIYVNFILGLGAIFGNACGVFWIIRKYQFTGLKVEKQVLKDAFIADFKFCISQLFLSMRQYAPIIIIGYLSGNFVAGQYKIIEQIVMLFRTYAQMFFRFVYGIICYEINLSKQKGLEIWKKYNGLNTVFIVLIIAVLFFNSDLVLRFFKIDVSHLSYMNDLLRFSLIIPVLFAVSTPLEQLMFAFDKNRIYINITIVLTFVNIVLLIIAVQLFDLYGAILSIAVTELIIIFAYCFSLKHTLKTRNSSNGYND